MRAFDSKDATIPEWIMASLLTKLFSSFVQRRWQKRGISSSIFGRFFVKMLYWRGTRPLPPFYHVVYSANNSPSSCWTSGWRQHDYSGVKGQPPRNIARYNIPRRKRRTQQKEVPREFRLNGKNSECESPISRPTYSPGILWWSKSKCIVHLIIHERTKQQMSFAPIWEYLCF